MLVPRNFYRYGGDDAISKRNSSRNQRFSRHRNRDRFRQDRHTLERERVAERSPRRFVKIQMINSKSTTN